MEMNAKLDKRQAKLHRIVNELKDLADGIHLHQQIRNNVIPSTP